jgi:hypothetical protein
MFDRLTSCDAAQNAAIWLQACVQRRVVCACELRVYLRVCALVFVCAAHHV